MKRGWWIFPFALFAGFAVFPISSRGGVVLVDKDESMIYISGGKFKEVSAEDPQTIVFDVDGQVLMVIDSEQKAYARGSVEEFCGAVSAAMGVAMEGMTDEEKEMMKQFMSAAGNREPGVPPDVIVVSNGGGGKIAGLDTAKYTVKVDGEVFEEVWLTDDKRIMNEFKSFSGLASMTSKMAACTLNELGVGTSDSPYASPPYTTLLEKGYPVKVVSYEDGAPADEDEVVEVKQQHIPDTYFAPPGEYRKISFIEMMQ